MIDNRVTELAKLMASHSTKLGPQDKVLLHTFDIPDDCVAQFVKACQETGAQVVLRPVQGKSRRQLMLGLTEDNIKTIADIELMEMEQMTAYIALRGGDNYAELSEVSSETNASWQKIYGQSVVQHRVRKTKWVVTRWPSPSMAQQAGMSTSAFEDFFFKVTTVDYAKMAKACEPLKELMDQTDRVHIIGPGTDLKFSIKDIGSVPCCGEANIPDGECFSCPVKESVEGHITYNTVSLYQGTEFNDIHYKVKNGRIYEATAGGNTGKLNDILDTDEGARYFGEWALGFNPHILEPMKDTLFDEKIAGSFHLTPGNAYEPPGGNGNVSAIHWDTVLIQRPEYGGGEIWFDGVLVRKDGDFVLEQLKGLNQNQLGKP